MPFLKPSQLFWRLMLAAPLALIGLTLVLPSSSTAQTFDATTLRQPTALGMRWLIKAGDDPAYAQTDFDDSHWTIYDPNTTIKNQFPNGRPAVVWYRLHVKVSPSQTGLGLLESFISSAFEIYVNGQRILYTGRVAPYQPWSTSGQLLGRIPDSAVAGGSLVIALRVHISEQGWMSSYPGFYPQNLIFGEWSGLQNQRWLSAIGGNALSWFDLLVGVGVGIVALALFAAERGQREYLWVFLQFLTLTLDAPLSLYRLFHNLPAAWGWVDELFSLTNLIFYTLIFFTLLRAPFGRWIKTILGVSIAAGMISMAPSFPGSGSAWFVFLTSLPISILLGGVIPGMLVVHWRRGNREAGILLIPAIFYGLMIYAILVIFILGTIPSLAPVALGIQNFIFNFQIGPFVLDLGSVSAGLYVLSLAIIIVLRSTRMSRQQAMIESELAAAREVQQIILPEPIERVPGFSIESAYAPAQEVGGDFFQILPAPEGSLLVVIGDVAGKGLPAAMLVSVLVGAIRGVAEYTSEPAELLANLNQRLVGRVSGGFATAMAARIYPDGSMTIANAGHLPPYLDGHEVAVPGALPLGAKAGTHYETMRAQLPRGSRLTFYSDGIVEATNTKGELLGFDRSQLLSMEPVSKIVEEAQGFGQQDDMTVIAITRDAVVAREPAMAQQVAIGAAALAN